ncbi:MAG: ABC transporter substrate-binding protein [Chloroflexota bacterium]
MNAIVSPDPSQQLEQAIAALEAQRTVLGDAVVDASIAALREKLAALSAQEMTSPHLRGERRLVTVMFADVSGFTALSERMDPETVRDLMNACFECLVPVVKKYGGAVDKFIGDAIMALFGAPVAHEDDPVRALHAALDMQTQLLTFNAQHATDLGIHFGINTGPVIAGDLGTRQRQEYTVMGDTVNVAARLEDISERGEILVGPDTYRLAAPLFEFETMVPVRVKGKSEPVPVYRLLAARAIPGKMRGIVGLASPLVGREVEFRALQKAIERVQAGAGGIVTLMGDAGLGKSRLVAEIRGGVAAAPLQWVEGRCLSYGASIAYLLWLDILRGLLSVAADATPTAVREALLQQTQTLCPDRFDQVFPYLARLLSLPLAPKDEATLHELDGETLKARTFDAVAAWIERAAQHRPVAVICEDLHWADPTSLELLEQLLPLVDRAPLLFVCLFRPEREHRCWRIQEIAGRDYPHRHTGLALDPLSVAEGKELVGHLLRVEGLPLPLRERILSHAEGNPFYVEEIIRSLIDDGAIVHDQAAGRWQATRDVADITIPDTLHGVLMARIDRLHRESKRVLQLASVIGRLFFYRVLAEIAREQQRLDDHLLTLQREEMIRERARTPELEYIFKHQLTQEAAYNGLLKKERRAYHRQVAETLERLFPGRVEEQLGLLAYHWERAEEPDKATAYLLQAGDQARLAYAHAEAIDYYQRALAFLKEQKEHERAARTLMKLGLTYHTAFDFARSRQAYEEGFALWKRVGETREGGWLPPAPHALRTLWNDPPTLDPTLADDSASVDLIDQLFSGLVALDAGDNIVPDVARNWEVLEDGCRFVFYLRDDVYWSDGTPVTAGDFAYAWKRTLDPATGSPAAHLLYDIRGARAFHRGACPEPAEGACPEPAEGACPEPAEGACPEPAEGACPEPAEGTCPEPVEGETGSKDVGIQALDDLTLLVELEGPTGYFLNLLAQSACYPVPRHVVAARGETWAEAQHIVTNGPFRLASWQRGQAIVLTRNPAYHGRSLVRGNVERVELDLRNTDHAIRLEMYKADELDVVDLPPLEIDRARQKHAGEYVSFPLLNTEYVGFDVSRPPFDDPRVRCAFALATDRETLADVVLRGHVSPATGGFVPPGMPGHAAGIGLPHDPERARRLLAEAGYPDGRGFPKVDAWTRSISRPHIGCLQAQWRDRLGIEIVWQPVAWAVYLDELRKKLPHLFIMGWVADYPDPDNFLRVGLWRERAGWRNEDYDRLIEQARRMTDQKERIRLYAQAEKILIQTATILPLYYGRLHRLLKPWIGEPPPSATGGPRWKDVIVEPH